MATSTEGNNPTKEDWLKLAELTQGDFATRRDLEWKLSLGLWGGVAAAVYAIFQNKNVQAFICEHPRSLGTVLGAVWLVHASVVFLIQLSHVKDKKLYWWYRNKVENGTIPRPWPVDERPSFHVQFCDSGSARWGWFIYHLVITALVLIGTGVLLSRPVQEKASDQPADRPSAISTSK